MIKRKIGDSSIICCDGCFEAFDEDELTQQGKLLLCKSCYGEYIQNELRNAKQDLCFWASYIGATFLLVVVVGVLGACTGLQALYALFLFNLPVVILIWRKFDKEFLSFDIMSKVVLSVWAIFMGAVLAPYLIVKGVICIICDMKKLQITK